MSETGPRTKKLDLSLEGLEVSLSGAIPERENWTERAMDRGILEFVALFSGLIFKYGGRVIHGSHPSFTPIILRQARLHSTRTDRPPVTLVMSELWYVDYTADEIQSMTDVAELIVTKKIGDGTDAHTQTRNSSLTAMRKVLIAAQNMMVAVGGKMHEKDGANPGVAEEMALAEMHKIPRYLIGGLGGYSQKLAAELTPRSLNNELSMKENVQLFGTADVSSCVNIVFENLCQHYWTHKRIQLPLTTLSGVEEFIRTTVPQKREEARPRRRPSP
jgi:SLOG cluster2